MIVYLLRHAWAGHRETWDGDDDRLRPLDERGRRQAGALVDQLDGHELARIVSSPYVRCVQTVEPLAEALGLPLEVHDSLEEGAGSCAALELLRNEAGPVVVSVHGDLALELLGTTLKKGATAVLELNEDAIEVLEHLDPPA